MIASCKDHNNGEKVFLKVGGMSSLEIKQEFDIISELAEGIHILNGTRLCKDALGKHALVVPKVAMKIDWRSWKSQSFARLLTMFAMSWSLCTRNESFIMSSQNTFSKLIPRTCSLTLGQLFIICILAIHIKLCFSEFSC
jgi:hypothetical protein